MASQLGNLTSNIRKVRVNKKGEDKKRERKEKEKDFP